MPTIWKAILAVSISILLVITSLYSWVLVSHDPLFNWLSKRAPLPIACSSNGCILTTDWWKYHETYTHFSFASKTKQPTSKDSLEVMIVRHLIDNAQLISPVTIADASRYRKDILNLTNEATIEKTVGLTAKEYDKIIILPYLKQESLKQQRKITNVNELYKQLAQEQRLIILPYSLKWDKREAKIETNDFYHSKK